MSERLSGPDLENMKRYIDTFATVVPLDDSEYWTWFNKSREWWSQHRPGLASEFANDYYHTMFNASSMMWDCRNNGCNIYNDIYMKGDDTIDH